MANTKKLDCVILGLLSHEPLTGYDIKQRMDMRLNLFWGASYGSIYPTLNTLAEGGMITSCDISDNGRTKIEYTITSKGHSYLKEWLKKPIEKDELRYETMLKLFFGSENGPEETLKHIEAFEEKIQKELDLLKRMEQSLEAVKEEEEAHLYYLLTAQFGIDTYETYLKWCKKVKRVLKEKGKRK